MIFHTDSKPSITFYGMFFRLAKPGFLLSRSCNHVSGCEKWLWSWRKSLFLKTRTHHFTQRLERASRPQKGFLRFFSKALNISGNSCYLCSSTKKRLTPLRNQPLHKFVMICFISKLLTLNFSLLVLSS